MPEQDESTSLAGCRVFVSYSHDSPEHEDRVLALANQLRNDGIEAWIDQYVPDPNEGWIRWMRSQVRQANRVLLVFIENYQRRFEGDEEEGKGLGATFEGVIVTQEIYESGGRNEKFRPVVFREEDERFIPLELRQFSRYRLNTWANYEALLRWLHGAPRIIVPIVGQRPDLAAKPATELFSRNPIIEIDRRTTQLKLRIPLTNKSYAAVIELRREIRRADEIRKTFCRAPKR
jgi:SEFIR domain